MLCYEDARPQEGIYWVRQGAQILFALSNPGHFLNTHLPHYHLMQDRIRAIETGRFIVRASPNGFSAVIDPNGKILTRSQLNEQRVLLAEVQPIERRTFFTTIGWLFPIGTSGIALLWVGWAYWRDSMNRRARSIR